MKRKRTRLTRDERRIADMHCAAYLVGRESCGDALQEAIFETRENVLKTFEIHIGGDPTRVFVDVEAKSEFLALFHKLRGQSRKEPG
jgi:hypothetical protein